ncbi:MAG: hypothetical protein KAR39_13415, partial [Thermoplasmata archaeon]|nr:hypothetical protein [Thermoplasmata archaeon]
MLPRVGAFFDDEVGSGQGIGTINAIFAPRLTDLIDAYGNTPEASIRNSTATFIDYASVLREVAIDEHRLNRGRRVENIPNTAQDIGTCVSTGDDDGEFVLTGFGAGNSDRYQRIVTLPVAGRAYLTSISVKASDASDVGNTIVLRIVDVAGGSPGAYTHTLTAEYKRITSPADTSYTGSALQVWVYSSGSASGCTCKDFMLEDITGDISQAPSEVISAATARWFDTTNGNTVAANIVTEAAGDPIHPFTIVDGAKLYTTVKDYATGIVVAAGGSMNDAGKWYTTATGGTTNGATLLTDIGVTDWVEQGIHWRDFGVLAEGSVQNKCTNFNANPDAGLTNLT